MKEIIKCNRCGGTADILYHCDTCGEANWLPNITLILNGVENEYHFCNYKCLNLFIIEELKKENKDE